jgi:hypothetical protein
MPAAAAMRAPRRIAARAMRTWVPVWAPRGRGSVERVVASACRVVASAIILNGVGKRARRARRGVRRGVARVMPWQSCAPRQRTAERSASSRADSSARGTELGSAGSDGAHRERCSAPYAPSPGKPAPSGQRSPKGSEPTYDVAGNGVLAVFSRVRKTCEPGKIIGTRPSLRRVLEINWRQRCYVAPGRRWRARAVLHPPPIRHERRSCRPFQVVPARRRLANTSRE